MEKVEGVLVDLDDCLMPAPTEINGKGMPPKFYRSLERIARLIEKANRFEFPVIGFCTGRPQTYVEGVASMVGLPDSWSIVEGGIALFQPKTKEVLSNPALTDEAKEVLEEISRERVPQILQKLPGLYLYKGNEVNVTLERKRGFELSIEECCLLVEKEVEDFLETRLINISYSSIAVDISPAGIDKASGGRFWSQQTGIDLARTLGIGDSQGDFPMFEVVGRIGCPANASKECREYVRKRGKEGYISARSYAGGVVDIIHHFIRG